MGGGEMIEHVGLDVSTYAPPPSRFEPGTPPIAEAIGMGAAAEYLGGLGLQAVRAYEEDIGRYLYERVRLAAVSVTRNACLLLHGCLSAPRTCILTKPQHQHQHRAVFGAATLALSTNTSACHTLKMKGWRAPAVEHNAWGYGVWAAADPGPRGALLIQRRGTARNRRLHVA